jgi:uncharacterized membrane protein
VLFIMISHHYPMTYGAHRPWLVLALLGATGVAVRHVFNLRHRGADPLPAIALAAGLGLVSVIYVAIDSASDSDPAPAADAPSDQAAASVPAAGPVGWAQIRPLIAHHCSSCHSLHPTNPAFPKPPLNIVLDSPEHAAALAPRIKAVAVDTQVMPLGNATGMTKAERVQLGTWIAEGAPQ